MNDIKFEWDENKNLNNYAKHGLKFEDAHCVFDSTTITFDDSRYQYGEKRYITLGLLFERVVVVVHTFREQHLRVISMRKANEREKKIYYKRLKTHR